MASAIYLDNFLESIEHLPKELQRNFLLMKDLDQRTQDTLSEVEDCVKHYKISGVTLPRDARKERLCKIDELYQKAKEYSDDKVQLAMQMYEMVDKHIRRLDADLGRFEQDLNITDHTHRRVSSLSNGEGQSIIINRNRKRVNETRIGSITRGRKKYASSSEETGPSGLASPVGVVPGGTSSDVLDMPVDPNEPTYCLCHQVSFGEMIGCDNLECPIEWFHFQCVGLTSKPKGKWFCPRCSQEREKNRKK